MSETQNATININESKDTLKLVVNKTHLGPIKGSGSKKATVSASANKARLNNNLKVEVVKEQVEKPEPKKANTSLLINQEGSLRGEDAIFYMIAWDLLYKGPGDPLYIVKANKLSKARSDVYEQLGIRADNKGKAPVLTEEQRSQYNKEVTPLSFDYYELALSFKQSGKRAVRSTSYRFANYPDLELVANKLHEKVEELKKQYKVSLKSGSVNSDSSVILTGDDNIVG